MYVGGVVGDPASREAGEEPFYIRRRVGHSKMAITTDRYGHTMQNRGQIAAHAADQFLPLPRV